MASTGQKSELRTSMWWERLQSILFPWVPRSVEHFVSHLFWFSIFFTVSTPLFRIFNNHWRSETSLYWLMILIMPKWLFDHCLNIGFIHPGIDYARDGETPTPDAAPVKGIDIAFSLHAGFALTWLVCAYIQMVHSHRKWISHRKFGYVSAAALLLHVLASIFNVYMDVAQHKPLPRIILVATSLSSASYMIEAIVVAIRKPRDWRNSHKDLMITCFLMSIQGAGPIRMVSLMQMWFGCGPIECQNRSGGLATNCMWEYVFRMACVNLWTYYTRGVYCRMRNDKQLTQVFLADLRNLCFIIVLLLAFSHLPHNEWMLDVVLGGERTARGTLTVVAFGVWQVRADLRRIIGVDRDSKLQQTEVRSEVALPRLLGRQLSTGVLMSSVYKTKGI